MTDPVISVIISNVEDIKDTRLVSMKFKSQLRPTDHENGKEAPK